MNAKSFCIHGVDSCEVTDEALPVITTASHRPSLSCPSDGYAWAWTMSKGRMSSRICSCQRWRLMDARARLKKEV